MKNRTVKNHKWALLLLFILATFLGAFAYIFDTKMDLNGDNMMYYCFAKSILQGGYTNIMSPLNAPTNTFPPGFPLILSFFMIFSKNLVFLKVINGFIFGAALFVMAYVLRLVFQTHEKGMDSQNSKRHYWLILPIIMSVAINPDVLHFASMLMSEMTYFLCLVLAALFLFKKKDTFDLKDPYFWSLVLVSAYAFHVRSAALALFGAVFFYFLLTKQWKSLLIYVPSYVALFLPWYFRNKIQGVASGRYLSQIQQVNAWDTTAGTLDMSGYLERFWVNLRDIVTREVVDGLFCIDVKYGGEATAMEWVVGLFLLALILFGLFKIKKIGLYLVGLVLATGVILLPWNGGGGTRYIISIIPILYLGLFNAIYELMCVLKMKKLWQMLLPYAMLIIIFFSVKGELGRMHDYANRDFQPNFKNYFKIGEVIDKNLPEDAYVCCRKPALLYYYANRAVGSFSTSSDTKVMLQKMLDRGFDYVVLDQLGYASTYKYLYPMIKAYPSVFIPVCHLTKPDTYLLKIDKVAAQKSLELPVESSQE